ncbi:MAG: hypothetical protein LBG96_16575 [Tannerella sp.]|jgi:hypothetical protein|nr:hypothetical protein [Tannerella sp.]
MSAFEKINGIRQIDPQSLIELSLSFAREEGMNQRETAKHICRELRDFMQETNTVITAREFSECYSNFVSFEEKFRQTCNSVQ